jgi:type II secretion system protein N
MNILKKKAIWFTIYGIFITIVFLYVLFPTDIVKSRLEEAVSSSGFILKIDSLRSSIPLGLKMKNVTLSSSSSPNIYFQGDSLDLQYNPVSFFRKSKYVGLSGRAYGGNFSGRFGLVSFSRIYPPEEGKLTIQNIDLGKYAFIKILMGREITGQASGNWTFNNSADRNSGVINLLLNKGTFALAEPFLGLSRIDFNRGEIKAIIEHGRVKLEKLEIFGSQLDCFLNGEIMLADDFRNSQINLNGEMTIAEKKVKMKINVGGTLANPAIRYI